MPIKQNAATLDPEIAAINAVHSEIKSLEPDAQSRVLAYVVGKLGIRLDVRTWSDSSDSSPPFIPPSESRFSNSPLGDSSAAATTDDGINVIAQKWMKRNGLTALQLSAVYSLGGDEIDLIAKAVPGKSKRQRMHNVLLLKGIASYLGGGAARVSHEQFKETCLHYDAYDAPNFAKNIKEFASDVSGTKQSGYTLTQRGLAAATELIKQLTATKV